MELRIESGGIPSRCTDGGVIHGCFEQVGPASVCAHTGPDNRVAARGACLPC